MFCCNDCIVVVEVVVEVVVIEGGRREGRGRHRLGHFHGRCGLLVFCCNFCIVMVVVVEVVVIEGGRNEAVLS